MTLPPRLLALVAVASLSLAGGRPAAGAPPERADPAPRAVPRPVPQAAVCRPTSGDLAGGATLADRAGPYRLTMVQIVDGEQVRSAQGGLTLRAQSPGLDSLGSASTPLYGFTSIDLRAVGAHRVGDPASETPEAPGVLVLESGSSEDRRILLRLGADANRRDTALVDGAWTVLEVREVTAGGFAGGWRSGVRLSRTEGRFCATKAPPPGDR